MPNKIFLSGLIQISSPYLLCSKCHQGFWSEIRASNFRTDFQISADLNGSTRSGSVNLIGFTDYILNNYSLRLFEKFLRFHQHYFKFFGYYMIKNFKFFNYFLKSGSVPDPAILIMHIPESECLSGIRNFEALVWIDLI